MRTQTTSRAIAAIAMAAALALSACSKKDEAATTSANNPEKISGLIGTVDTAVKGTGTKLAADSFTSASARAARNPDTDCSEHGQPMDGASTMSSSNRKFPLLQFYCMLSKDTGSPDSVPGSYSLIKQLGCELEKTGISWNGGAKEVVLTLTDECGFTDEDREDMGNDMTITVTATKPAAFNTYYDTGIELSVNGFGGFRMAGKVTGNKVEFAAMEDQTDVSPNKTGTYAASFDKDTGQLWFEARHDRYACAGTGSCGWSRHSRLYAKLTYSGNEITDVQDFSGIHSEVYSPSNGDSGWIATLKGNLTDGLRGRHWAATGTANLYTATAYSESNAANTTCFTSSSDAATCTSNTGIAIPSSGSLPFTLISAASPTSTSSWFTTHGAFTFTAATFDDVQN